MLRKMFITLSALISSVMMVDAQWALNGTTEYYSGGNVGIGTNAPAGQLGVISNPIVYNAVTTLGIFGYSNLTSNRSICIQQISNVNTANQFLFLNGGLGSSTILGIPTLTSIYAPTFGFESNDNNLNIITAPAGTNVAAKRAMSFLSNGNVLIGKTTQTNGTYSLDVNGNGRFNKIVVNTTGADYVFDSLYNLAPLEVVEKYIRQHHHLPDIAPASQMQQEGLDLGDNQVQLLRKIEELTLHLIRQNKELEAQRERIDRLEKLLQTNK